MATPPLTQTQDTPEEDGEMFAECSTLPQDTTAGHIRPHSRGIEVHRSQQAQTFLFNQPPLLRPQSPTIPLIASMTQYG